MEKTVLQYNLWIYLMTDQRVQTPVPAQAERYYGGADLQEWRGKAQYPLPQCTDRIMSQVRFKTGLVR